MVLYERRAGRGRVEGEGKKPGATEGRLSGVSGELITAAVPLPAADVAFCPQAEDAIAAVVGWARPGDLVLTIGAGDVTALGPMLLLALTATAVPAPTELQG